MRIRNDFGVGPARAATGGDASREVALSSNLADQVGRSKEHQLLGQMFCEIGAAMKAASEAWTLPRASAAGVSYVGAAQKALKLAKSAVRRAEMDADDGVEDEDGEDGEDLTKKAEKHLKKAKKLLARAVEEDESEEDIDKAREGVRKVSKAITELKAKPLKDLEQKADLLKSKLAEIKGLLGNASRGSSVPPSFSIAKAEAPVGAGGLGMRIASMADAGVLNHDQAIQARTIANHLSIAKAGGVDLEVVRREIARAPLAVRGVFGDI